MKPALVAVLGLLLASHAAHANVEIGGIAGAHVFSDTNGLGVNSHPHADSEKNSSLFGLRLGFYFNDLLGIEAEGGVVPSEPRSMVFDIWNASYRGHVIAQFRAADASNLFVPFVLAGGGAMELVYSKNEVIMHKDRDGMVYVGGGVKYRAPNNWGIRGDVRLIVVPSSAGGQTLDFEGLLAIYREYGRKAAPKKIEAVVIEKKEDVDPDHDGILGPADKCPTEAEDKDGFEDDDGCPDPDNDKDGIPDAADKCPNEAEDKDGFQDEDGCPDPDNDGDGIPDAADKCVDQPETKNGFEDEDGCPDEVPAKLAAFTGAIQGINFKLGSAELAPESSKVLDKAIAVLAEFKGIHLEIQGHTDDQAPGKGAKFPSNEALSQARAESVKAYFVKKGIEDARLVAKGYGDTVPLDDPKVLKGAALNAARAKNRRVEFKLLANTPTPVAPVAPIAPPTPAPTAPAPAKP